MANLKEIRRRIGSVKGTQKITSAMKMVAAAKLRKAQENADNFRAYADLTSSILTEVAAESNDDDHPLLERREVKKSLLLVISSDRGLCGGFNGNLNKLVFKYVQEAEIKPVLAVIGKKSKIYLEHRNVAVTHYYSEVYDDFGYDTAASVAKRLAAMYESGEVDKIDLAYNDMISMSSQVPSLHPLFPIELPEKQDDADDNIGTSGFIFEPEQKQLLGTLLPKYVEVSVFRALLESVAAEESARMMAMELATNNAQEMIDSLTLVYNRARQSAITTELMDIVGGAEALND